MLKIYDLTIEYKHEPLGLDEIQPRFGWKLDSDSTIPCRPPTACSCSVTVNPSGIPGAWRVRRVF